MVEEKAKQQTSIKQVPSTALLVSFLAHSSTMKMVVTCSSKMSANDQWATFISQQI
jgi:hypothetical protein